MILIRPNRPRGRRRAMILMVVLALMTLFAIVGISFVYVANSQETAARIAREAETQFRPQVDPEAAFAYVMGQLLYDCNDREEVITLPDNTKIIHPSGVQSALRGHSLARNMYGWWDGANPGQPAASGVLNDKPFSGTGKLFTAQNVPFGFYDAQLQNFQYYQSDNFVRDPERIGTRTNATAAVSNWYSGGFNPPYTYPDHNHFFLAQLDPNTGEVVVPSFHREYLFGRLNDSSNPNWSNAHGKYLTVRPTRQHHTNFPLPADRFGDVKNLDNAPGGADSIWIDVGAPVMTSPDGRKYKMLVAPLILELDNRLNLNVVGNWMGGSKAEHRSHQGWGPWEVNPAKVMNVDAAEWRKLFEGSSNTGLARFRGRYDQDGNPRGLTGRALAGGSGVRTWSQVDFDAKDTAANPAARMTFPLPNSTPGWFFGLPIYDPNTFGNGGAENTADHAACFNVARPLGANRLFPVNQMAQLLRYGGSGYQMLDSDVLQLLKQNLATDTNALRRRQMVTLLSADLDRPSVMPYIWDYQAVAPSRLQVNVGADGKPSLAGNQPIATPPIAQRPATPATSEFNSNTWRSQLANLGRLDLPGRIGLLPAYNPPSDATVHNRATQARQKLVGEIFEILCRVTGARCIDPATQTFSAKPAHDLGVDSEEFRTLLHLAQLAVNIVDAHDNDDVSTPYQLPGLASPIYVFGFESPRLVINEVYAQYDNHKPDVDNVLNQVKADGSYTMNVWAELMNPIAQDDLAPGPKVSTPPAGYNNTAADCVANLAAYRLRMLDHRAVTSLRDLSNWDSNPDKGKMPADASRILSDDKGEKTISAADWGAGARVLPFLASQRFDHGTSTFPNKTGFFVVGPKDIQWDDPMRDDPAFNPKPDLETDKLSWMYKAADFEDMNKVRIRPLVVLQRLANPNLPAQPDPSMGNYNPYVTVDYWEVKEPEIMDGRFYDRAGNNANHKAMADRTSFARRQPLAAYDADPERKPSATNDAALMNRPKVTWFRQNSQENDATAFSGQANDPVLKKPFDWMVHLDRLPISPGELLHVSALRPYDVLRYFVVNNSAHQHIAPWADPSARLHRFFEFLTTSSDPYRYDLNTGSPSPGYWGRPNSRVPGKINLNTVMHPEIFRAICDANNGNVFTETEVNTLFNTLLDARTPVVNDTYANPPVARRMAGPTDQRLLTGIFTAVNKPFLGFAAGGVNSDPNDLLLQGIRGTDLSLLRGHPNPLLLDVPATNTNVQHPFQRKELLTKILNHLTTRSNVFAVWMTVGFFEVTDDTTQPPKLGNEIGKDENRHIRFRMFTIVDRTNIKAFDTTSGVNITPDPNLKYVTTNVNLAGQSGPNIQVSDPRTGRNWTVAEGTVLVYEPGTDNEEAVVVRKDPSSGTLVADFVRNHANGCRVICRGNPGPMTRYDPRKDTEVVPYFLLLD